LRKAKELSALEVGRLKVPGLHAVGGVAGLCMQVAPGGARTWILRITVGDRRRDMGLGGFPDVTLAMAREKARAARELVDQGIDPVLQRQRAKSLLRAQQAASKTFAQCAREYIEAKAPEWSNPKHEQQWTNTLETYAFPTLGSLLVADVGVPQVLGVLKPIWQEKTETATRVRGRMEAVLDFATVQHYRQGPNPARWKGHLDKMLAEPAKFRVVKHHAALGIDALPDFMVRLRAAAGMGAKALELLILTAARSGELRGARWSEIDLQERQWTVPAERMKGGREHRVPLSKAALQLLAELARVEGADLLFSSSKGLPLSDMTLTAVLRRMEVAAVPHGFRSTFRDWCSERTNYPSEVAEMVMAHVIEKKVEAVYRRGDLFDKRRHLMDDWADFCGNAAMALRTRGRA
jgi:integrase